MRDPARDNPNFVYVMTVESVPSGWHGEQRRVDADMVRRYVSDLHQPIHYLSGPATRYGTSWIYI